MASGAAAVALLIVSMNMKLIVFVADSAFLNVVGQVGSQPGPARGPGLPAWRLALEVVFDLVGIG